MILSKENYGCPKSRVDWAGGNVNENVRRLPREAYQSEANSQMEALLIEGLTTGEHIPMSPEFWRKLKQEAKSLTPRTRVSGATDG